LATSAKKSPKQGSESPLAVFSARTRSWFERSFQSATPAQEAGWPKIATGANTLICAPTGSGKTLAAFLWGIDSLARRPDQLGAGVKIVYVSPLKALSYDVERNLRAPLAGIGADVAVGLRTGDTPQKERQAMLRTPPDILITTPESLYLMMTSRARKILTGVEAVIVDEIHAVAPTKRGAHMALTIERLDHHVQHPEADEQLELTDQDLELLPRKPLQRIGLSATQRPLDRIARFLAGPGRECEIVDAGVRKELDLEIVVPVEDMADPGSVAPAPIGAPDQTASTLSSPASPTIARSGRRSTRSSWSWSRSTPPRSSSSTTAAVPNASPSGSTS
jgi:ATP-dependent helicase Lhr and Lhr-like helicase